MRCKISIKHAFFIQIWLILWLIENFPHFENFNEGITDDSYCLNYGWLRVFTIQTFVIFNLSANSCDGSKCAAYRVYKRWQGEDYWPKWAECNSRLNIGCKAMWRFLTCYVRNFNQWIWKGVLSPITWMYSVFVCTTLSLTCTSYGVLRDFWWISTGGIQVQ